VSGAFPNLLEAIAVRGNLAYVPGTCSSPNGPFRFNVNVQSCLSTIDTMGDVEAFGSGTTLNMNVGVNFEPAGVKLFNTNPFAIAFKQSAAEGFVVLAATDRLLRVTLNDNGVPTINPPANAGDPGNIVRIELKDPDEILTPDPDDTIGGKNPRGIVLNSKDTRAYVMDFVSRDIAVVDISGNDPKLYHTIARIPSAQLPRREAKRPLFSVASIYSTAPSAGRHGGELETSGRTHVGYGLGDLLQLSRARADRQRDLDVPGWAAASDLDGEHFPIREWQAAGSYSQRRPCAARFASAGAQLVGRS
jgi:hypothetical protein